MILIGLYDSPFVRRTAIAMKLYGLAYEHRPWSVWGDADQIRRYNPLIRVPTLVLDDGEVLIESGVILDYLDESVGPGQALIAQSGKSRRQALRICALATGLADKAVSLLYEGLLHQQASEDWVDRCRSQITAVLGVLERDRAEAKGPFLLGSSIGHADIAVACALRLLREAHPRVFDAAAFPALTAHAKQCEALPVFGEVALPLFSSKSFSVKSGEGRMAHMLAGLAVIFMPGRFYAPVPRDAL